MACTSCGSEIPDGQGSSCSMCYGDIGYGSDGYYQAYMDEWARQTQQEEDELQEYLNELHRSYEMLMSWKKL